MCETLENRSCPAAGIAAAAIRDHRGEIMGCCGEGRAALRNSTVATPGMFGKGSVGGGATGDVSLHWLKPGARTIIGPVSGHRYGVSAARSRVMVDRRDAAALVATGFFALG